MMVLQVEFQRGVGADFTAAYVQPSEGQISPTDEKVLKESMNRRRCSLSFISNNSKKPHQDGKVKHASDHIHSSEPKFQFSSVLGEA